MMLEKRTYGQYAEITVKPDALLHDKIKAIKGGIRILLEGLEKEWKVLPELETMQIIIKFDQHSPFNPRNMTIGVRVDGIAITTE